MELWNDQYIRTAMPLFTSRGARFGTWPSSKVSIIPYTTFYRESQTYPAISALADYGPTIEDFTDSLLTRIDTLVGKATVVNDLCIHYSYDVMSSLAFGSSTGFIDGTSSDVATTILNNIKEGIVAVGLFLHVPWMLTIVETLSFVGPMKLFKSWSSEKVAERRKMNNNRPDIMGYLLEHTEDNKENRALLDAESRVIIGAGRYGCP
jgi:cytochrome P450